MATEQQILKAFQNGVRGIVDDAPFGRLRDAIRSGDYGAAVELLSIYPEQFDELRVALVETYAQGGVSEVSGMRFKPRVVWNGATPQSEQYARTATAHMEDLAESMRSAVSWQIGDSLAFGRSANQTALDLVGRIGASGKREGGIVGLNDQRTAWVAGLRKKLLAGDPVDLTLLTAAERKMIDDGNLSTQQIERIVQSYANRQLLSRGKAIARTERGLAINQGRYSAWVQAADRLGVPYTSVRKKWKHNGAHKYERYEHIALGNQPAIPLPQTFVVGGHDALYPHDPMLPASEVINCDCTVVYSIPGVRRG